MSAEPEFSHMLTSLFVAALLLSVAIKLWLGSRQIRHVALHRNRVPARFAASVPLDAHQKAADYTVAKTHLAFAYTITEAAFLVALTLLGGLQALDDTLARWLVTSSLGMLWRQVLLIGLVMLISAIIDIPFGLYRQFVLEQRFGFNRMSALLFVRDLITSTLVSIVLGGPLLFAVLDLMQQAGTLWWLYAWLVLVGFSLLVNWLYPVVIAPLYNRFVPLADATLLARIRTLASRCGFTARDIFIMDGSKRSAHGNAYFTGFGNNKRIVFFDTLIERLNADEIEAVLAHELGHLKLKHLIKRMAWFFPGSLAALAALGYLAEQPWFYLGLGVDPSLATRNAMALILFMMVLPVFLFLLSPLLSMGSRRHEFEADAFAAAQTDRHQLVAALVKLSHDNAVTLTPDPLHSAFFDSHPPAPIRIARLEGVPA